MLFVKLFICFFPACILIYKPFRLYFKLTASFFFSRFRDSFFFLIEPETFFVLVTYFSALSLLPVRQALQVQEELDGPFEIRMRERKIIHLSVLSEIFPPKVQHEEAFNYAAFRDQVVREEGVLSYVVYDNRRIIIYCLY